MALMRYLYLSEYAFLDRQSGIKRFLSANIYGAYLMLLRLKLLHGQNKLNIHEW